MDDLSIANQQRPPFEGPDCRAAWADKKHGNPAFSHGPDHLLGRQTALHIGGKRMKANQQTGPANHPFEIKHPDQILGRQIGQSLQIPVCLQILLTKPEDIPAIPSEQPDRPIPPPALWNAQIVKQTH
ncbi:MAG: hypothetical protein ACI4PD_00880, partial [Butyricicoccus sp.]